MAAGTQIHLEGSGGLECFWPPPAAEAISWMADVAMEWTSLCTFDPAYVVLFLSIFCLTLLGVQSWVSPSALGGLSSAPLCDGGKVMRKGSNPVCSADPSLASLDAEVN